MCPSAVKFVKNHTGHDIKDMEQLTKLSDEVFKIEAEIEKTGKTSDEQIASAQKLTDQVYAIAKKIGHDKKDIIYMDDHMEAIKDPSKAGSMKEQYVREDDMKGMSVSSGHKRPTDKGAGMTAKGVAAYRRRNPGSKLKTAVTTKPSKLKPGSKAAGRRQAFCARSRSWTGERGKAARRRWNC